MLIYDSAHIDSLSLSIPIENCTILNSNFTSRIVTYYYDTEEFDEELQNSKPLVFTYDGITVRFRIAERFTGKTTHKFIILTLSAKMLKTRYFQGITIYNTKFLHQEILNLGVIDISYADFLDSRVSDVDVCTNYKIDEFTFVKANKKLITLAQNGKDRFFNFFEKMNRQKQYINLGLEVNSRPKAKPSTPYFKNYYKTIELTTKSLEFYNNFLKNEMLKNNQSIRNLARIEYTIKGFKHKERLIKKGLLKNNFNTLKELLMVPKDQLKKIIYSGFKEYLEIPKNLGSKKSYSGLSPTDALIINYMEQLILSGKDKIDLMEIISMFQGTQRARLKSKINKLWSFIQSNNEALINKHKENEQVQQFIRKIEDNS